MAALRKAIELKPDLGEAHCNLGSCLRRQGDLAGALAALQRGHELGSRRRNWPYPSGQWLREYRRLVEIAPRLPDFLRGKVRPAGAVQWHEYAQLCRCNQFPVAAARARLAAFQAEPKRADDLQAGHRYDAACAAALAGCGQGKDAGTLTPGQRLRWRRQALTWLRADLALRREQLARGTNADRAEAQQKLRYWQQDADLAGLRDREALDKLPAEERHACRRLWSEIEVLLAGTTAGR